MSLIPRQPDADHEVIAYWLDKLRWTAVEFSALYCGVNPYALEADDDWNSRRRLGMLNDKEQNYQTKVPAEKRINIEEILVLIHDRLEPHDQILGSPRNWRLKLTALRLPELPWMQQIQEPEKENPVKTDVPLEKPLDPRSQNTLLIIIEALCEHSDVKTNEHGAATKIAKLTQKIGAPVDADTVRKWLKQIPKAMESRGK
jgi:hypothetical protein